MNSIKSWNKMDTIFVNSKNRKTSDLSRLLLNLSIKIDLKRSDKYVALSNFSIYYTLKNIKSHTKAINWKYLSQSGMKNLNYLMDHICNRLFKIIFSKILKKHW